MSKMNIISVDNLSRVDDGLTDQYIHCFTDDSFFKWVDGDESGPGRYVLVPSPTDVVVVLEKLVDKESKTYMQPDGQSITFDETTWYAFKEDKLFFRYLEGYGLYEIGAFVQGEGDDISRMVFRSVEAFPPRGPVYYHLVAKNTGLFFRWDFGTDTYRLLDLDHPNVEKMRDIHFITKEDMGSTKESPFVVSSELASKIAINIDRPITDEPRVDVGAMARDRLVSKKSNIALKLKRMFVFATLALFATLAILGYILFETWEKRTVDWRNDYHMCYIKLGNTVVEGHRRYRSKVTTYLGYNFVDKSAIAEETTIESSSLAFRLIGYGVDGPWIHNNQQGGNKRTTLLKDTPHYTFVTANDITVVSYADFCDVARPEE